MWLLLLACGQLFDVAPTSTESRSARTFRTHLVDCEGGARFTTIDEALEVARSGDVIRVAPCTYEGSINFNGKAVTIESTEGADLTTLVATPGKSAIKANDGEGPGTAVIGFTITGGGAPGEPAVEVQFSSLHLKDVRFVGNVGTSVVYSNTGHVLLERATFGANEATDGMVIRERRGMTVVRDSVVRCGGAAIGYIVEHGAGFVDGSTFDCPGAVGVDLYHSDGRVQRTVIEGLLRVENEQLEQNERAIIEDVVLQDGVTIDAAHVTLRNVVSLGEIATRDAVVVLESSIVAGATCGVRSLGSTITVRDTNLWDNDADLCGDVEQITSEGGLTADPRFVDRAAGDLRLAAGSPCIDAGPADADYRDPDGSVNDLGVYGGPLSIGGGW